jgi:hypothetical protein
MFSGITPKPRQAKAKENLKYRIQSKPQGQRLCFRIENNINSMRRPANGLSGISLNKVPVCM